MLSVCRRAKQQAEWEERQKVRAATQKEMAGEPFDAEVTKCEQLTAYLAKFTAQAEAQNAAAAGGGTAAAPPKGYSMPKKKGEQNLGHASKIEQLAGGCHAILGDSAPLQQDQGMRLLPWPRRAACPREG